MDVYNAQRTCGATGVTLRLLTHAGEQHVANLKRLMGDGPLRNEEWRRDVARNVRLIEVTTLMLDECPVVDREVEVSFQQTGGTAGIEHWICPACGAAHHEEVDADDDDR